MPKSATTSRPNAKPYPLLASKRIGAKQLASFLRAAIRRNDPVALREARRVLGRVKGDELAMLLFQLAFDAKTTKDTVAVGLELQELAMAADDAPIESHVNALCYLGLIKKRATYFDPELTRGWLERVVPKGPAASTIYPNAAGLYVDLGEHEVALRMVAGALLYGYEKAAALEHDEELAPLHGDRRFRKLFAKGATRDTYRAVFEGGGARRVGGMRDEGLEAAILVDPTAVEPYLVYGDWLQERGDPRGELIAVQHALRKSPKSAALQRQERELIAKHAAQLRGTAAITKASTGKDAMTLEWHLGFVRRACFTYVSYLVEDNHIPDIPTLIRDFFRGASSRFLQELVIGVYAPGDGYEPVVKAMLAAGPHPTVRSLHIAQRTHEESELSWVGLGKLGKLWSSFPALERLIIEAGQFDLGEIETASLRELEIRTSGLSRKNVQRICAARWPQLEKLQIWFGSKTYGSQASVADLQPLLDGIELPSLKYLGLMNAELTDALAAALPRAKILKQLSVLDLSMGTLTHAGLGTLIANAPAFRHLDVLDLSSNHLTGRRDPAAKQLAKRVIFDDQRELYDFLEESNGRYVQIGE